MTRMTWPDCAVICMCNIINSLHTHGVHTRTQTLSRPSRFAPSARLMVCVSPRALWLVGNFSSDCMFWDERGGGLTGQPVGPQVDTATIITVVLGTNRRVDSSSFSPRCWAFRLTHTSANPFRLLCIRLALPLTLSLPSGFVPSARLLMVGDASCALWLVWDFSCDYIFRDKRGGRLTGQPMGPQVDTETITRGIEHKSRGLEKF